MAITQDEILRLAKLAGLQLDDAGVQRAQHDLSRILGLIETLQAVDTDGIEPMAHPLAAHQDIVLRLREDAPDPAQSVAERDACLRNAPATRDGLFLVPTVID